MLFIGGIIKTIEETWLFRLKMIRDKCKSIVTLVEKRDCHIHN